MSWATALALGALILVATIDAFRGGGTTGTRPSPAAERSLAGRAELVRRLSRLGARGRLVFSDERCTIRALALPSLRATARPAALDPACGFSLSPDGRLASSSGADWSPNGRLVAVCRGAIVGVYVRRERGEARQAWDGCAPAWRPDGVLTLVREGELLAVREGCAAPPPCERVLLTRGALRRAAARHPNAPDVPGLVEEPELEDVVWLSRTRLVVLLGVRFGGRLARMEPVDLLAFFVGGRLVATRAGLDDHLTVLARSPSAAYIVAKPDQLFRSDGRPLPVPEAFVAIRAFAFSPDERLLAAATGSSVVVVELDRLARGDASRAVSIPIGAQDVAWR